MERGEDAADEERRRHIQESLPLVHRGGGGGGGGGAGSSRSRGAPHAFATVDGPLGLLDEDEMMSHARRFFWWGFCLLPFLWAVNCLYFWPVLRTSPSSSPNSFRRIRPYIVRSAIGFTIFAVLLSTWALTFAIGGERLFGPSWKELVMYNVANRLGLTGWM